MGSRGQRSASGKSSSKSAGEQILDTVENLLDTWINSEGSESINARRNLMNARKFAKNEMERKLVQKNMSQKEQKAFSKAVKIGDSVAKHYNSGKSKNSFNRFRKRYGV